MGALISLTVEATNGVPVVFTFPGLDDLATFNVSRNGTLVLTPESDGSGTLTFTLSQWGVQDTILIAEQPPPTQQKNIVFADFSANTGTLSVTQELGFTGVPCVLAFHEDGTAATVVVSCPDGNSTINFLDTPFETLKAPIQQVSFTFLSNGATLTIQSVKIAVAGLRTVFGSGVNSMFIDQSIFANRTTGGSNHGNLAESITDSSFGVSVGPATIATAWGSNGLMGASFGANYGGLSSVGYTIYNSFGGKIQDRTLAGITEQGFQTGTYTVQADPPSATLVLWDTGGLTPAFAAWSPGGVLYANFGTSFTGQTAFVTVYDTANNVQVARTAATFEIPATGVFGSPEPSLPSQFVGSVLWDLNPTPTVSYNISPAGGLQPTPSVTATSDNGLVTATVLGSAVNATNVISTILAVALPSNHWTTQGSRTGDGTVSFTLTAGLYLVRVISTTGSSSVTSPYSFVLVTISGQTTVQDASGVLEIVIDKDYLGIDSTAIQWQPMPNEAWPDLSNAGIEVNLFESKSLASKLFTTGGYVVVASAPGQVVGMDLLSTDLRSQGVTPGQYWVGVFATLQNGHAAPPLVVQQVMISSYGA